MSADPAPAIDAPMIEARALAKRYSGVRILDDISFALAPGSKTALLGSNGAGKTTLLAVLSTLISASSGEAWVAGLSIEGAPAELRRSIGVLSHRPMVYEELTPLENLRFFARLYGVGDSEARAEELLRQVGLWRRRDDTTLNLSRGMHQRLAIARALLHAPPVLLLDEPETGLDAEGLELLDETMLRAPGVTVLAATHQLGRVEAWADGVLRLDRGHVAEAPGQPAAAKAMAR